jgi:UDP-glucose 4-epimerase
MLALSGALDNRIVNIADDAPPSAYELVGLGGRKLAENAEPLSNPWYLHVDGCLARSLGFRPTVRTALQAQQKGLL